MQPKIKKIKLFKDGYIKRLEDNHFEALLPEAALLEYLPFAAIDNIERLDQHMYNFFIPEIKKVNLSDSKERFVKFFSGVNLDLHPLLTKKKNLIKNLHQEAKERDKDLPKEVLDALDKELGDKLAILEKEKQELEKVLQQQAPTIGKIVSEYIPFIRECDNTEVNKVKEASKDVDGFTKSIKCNLKIDQAKFLAFYKYCFTKTNFQHHICEALKALYVDIAPFFDKSMVDIDVTTTDDDKQIAFFCICNINYPNQISIRTHGTNEERLGLENRFGVIKAVKNHLLNNQYLVDRNAKEDFYITLSFDELLQHHKDFPVLSSVFGYYYNLTL